MGGQRAVMRRVCQARQVARERGEHNAWGCNARETGDTAAGQRLAVILQPGVKLYQLCALLANFLTSLSIPCPLLYRQMEALPLFYGASFLWFCTTSCLLLTPTLFRPNIYGVLSTSFPLLCNQSHSAALLLCSACSSAPCSPYQEINKDLLPELSSAFINQKIQTECKQHSLPCMPSTAYWIHIPLPPASLSFLICFFLICFDEWVTTLTPDSLRLIETTQYLRRADEQLSCHLSLRLSFWLKTTHPCNRNYLELEGNLWRLSLSLLFASVSILLPPPLRGILFSFIPSILSPFSLVDGNVCFAVQGFAVRGSLFVKMGETGQDCGQASTG